MRNGKVRGTGLGARTFPPRFHPPERRRESSLRTPRPGPPTPCPTGFPGGLFERAVAAFAAGEPRRAASRDREHVAPDAVLEVERLAPRHARALEHRAAVGEHRLLGEAGDLVRQLERAVEVPPRRDDLVGKPD